MSLHRFLLALIPRKLPNGAIKTETCHIEEIAPENSQRRFQIVENPQPTSEELAEQERLRKQAEAEAARLPDLEAAVAELGVTSASDKEETDEAALDLAAYAAELEQRIAKLEAKNG